MKFLIMMEGAIDEMTKLADEVKVENTICEGSNTVGDDTAEKVKDLSKQLYKDIETYIHEAKMKTEQLDADKKLSTSYDSTDNVVQDPDEMVQILKQLVRHIMAHFLNLVFKNTLLRCAGEEGTDEVDATLRAETLECLDDFSNNLIFMSYIFGISVQCIENNYLASVESLYSFARQQLSVPYDINIDIQKVFEECIADWHRDVTAVKADLNPSQDIKTAVETWTILRT